MLPFSPPTIRDPDGFFTSVNYAFSPVKHFFNFHLRRCLIISELFRKIRKCSLSEVYAVG